RAVVVGDLDAAVEEVVTAAAAHPMAVLSMAWLLRGGAGRSTRDGLLAESSTYSTLLAGPEFAAWLAHRGPRRAADAGERVRRGHGVAGVRGPGRRRAGCDLRPARDRDGPDPRRGRHGQQSAAHRPPTHRLARRDRPPPRCQHRARVGPGRCRRLTTAASAGC